MRSGKPRAVVRGSHSGMTVQLIEYSVEGDRVLATATFQDLKKLGWKFPTKNIEASYLTGLLAGMRAKRSKVKEAVLDIGLHEPIAGSRVFAALKGLLDAGLSVPHGDSILPLEKKLTGEHRDDEKFKKAFEEVKAKVLEM